MPVLTKAATITTFQSSSDTAGAAAAIAAGAQGSALTVVFATAHYDLTALGMELERRGIKHAIGASSGRIIGSSGFRALGVAGFHLPASRFACADTMLEDVSSMGLPELRARVHELRLKLNRAAASRLEHRFALLLVDAESRCEERLAAVLGMELNDVPLIGGSAGDLYFNPLAHPQVRPRLLHQGSDKHGAAVLCLVACTSPVAAFCHNHFVRSEKKFVITDADPARRLVREINGRPALEVYAAACGFARPPSEGRDFAPYPLMIRIGGQDYPRGMQRIYADGALEFACALERGLVVSLAKPGDMVASLGKLFASMRKRIGAPELVIGMDCAARTADMERKGLTGAVEGMLKRHAVTGFASLGEQFNTIHANNSFTCLAIGPEA